MRGKHYKDRRWFDKFDRKARRLHGPQSNKRHLQDPEEDSLWPSEEDEEGGEVLTESGMDGSMVEGNGLQTN